MEPATIDPARFKVRAILRTMFSIDLRTLALFRVVMASLLLIDLIDRWRYIRMLYTDQGFLPREGLVQLFGKSMQWTTLHYYTGASVAMQSVMFAIAAMAALALLGGYRTWTATVISWLLFVSLNRRVPAMCYGYDGVMRLMLFWSLFLPIGARWSVDSALRTEKRLASDRICSVATACILLQVCYIYWFTAILKLHPLWLEGEAVRQAMEFETFVRPLGRWLGRQHALTVLLTYATLIVEAFGPVLAIWPVRSVWTRWLAILLMCGLHVGIAACMKLGFFPHVSVMLWLLFIPTETWEGLFRRLQTPDRRALRIYYDDENELCQRVTRLLRTFLLLPETKLLRAQDDPLIDKMMRESNGWVVVDADGRQRIRFDGLVCVVRASPLLHWLALLLAWRPVASVGDRIYRLIARSRWPIRWVGLVFPWRPLRVQPRRSASVLACLLLFLVTAYNILGLDQLSRRGIRIPQAMRLTAQLLRVDQKWAMFAPRTETSGEWTDRWPVMPAILADGSIVDVWSGKPVTYDRPPLLSANFPHIRARNFLLSSLYKKPGSVWPWVARYVSRKWNASHPPSQAVQRVQIIFVGENEPGQDVLLPQVEYDAVQDTGVALSPAPFGWPVSESK